MNTPSRTIRAAAAGSLLLAVSLGACSSARDAGSVPDTAAVTDSTVVVRPAVLDQSEGYDNATLTQDEIDGLVWMREEEKLAHDVYATLYEQWNLPILDNISQSETTHTNAVAEVLDSFGIEDPAAGNDVGEFTDPILQDVYNQLITRGEESLIAALEVGAYIEEMDILDLRERESSTPAIDTLYDQLERGSRNHLRAFVRTLEREGVAYEPELMEADDFDAIVGTPTERGNAGAGSGNGPGRGGRRGGGGGGGGKA